MEDSLGLGEDLPLTSEQLFEYLSQIPGYTWDQSFPPIHSSYDHWQVTGFKHYNPEPDAVLSTPASSSLSRESVSTHDSPRTETRSNFFRTHARNSLSEANSEVQSPQHDILEPSLLPIVARVSRHIIRLEREFHMMKTIVDMSDPECKSTVRPIDIIRLPAPPPHHIPLMVTVFDNPGPNYLAQLGGFGSIFPKENGHEDGGAQISLPGFLDFAIGACECLELLHYGVKTIHGEIRPDAFNFQRETGTVKLSNTGNGALSFDKALSDGWAVLSRELWARDKLRFIAPEQTGRYVTDPDTRTDIYSLGILFWTVLVGAPAFDGEDLVDVVQNVLAKTLSPVSSRRMDIPGAVSRVIQKMVRKQIDERYHTISSVKWDLQQILTFLGNGDPASLSDFTIAQRDVSSFFTLPASLFGRQEEYNRILNVIEKVRRRQQTHRLQPASKSNLHPLYPISSGGSSVSGERLDSFEAGDVSSDSGSFGIAGIRNTSIPGPNPLGQTSTHDSTASVDSGLSSQRNLALSRVKSPTDSRQSWEITDRDSLTSAHNQFETLPSFGKRMAQSKYRHGGRCEVISISGTGGLGKSDLIHRVQPEIRKHGYIAVARLDRSRRVPFEPFIKILASFLQQIFSERDVTTEYHNRIRTVLRPVWSSLHRVLGLPEQLVFPFASNDQSLLSPPTPRHLQDLKEGAEIDLNYNDSRFRGWNQNKKFASTDADTLLFADAFIDVLRTMTFHKLICICLEDVQYSDDESAGLLLELMRTKLRCVIIVTGRPEEITTTDIRMLFQADSHHITKIELGPLSEDDILQYVAATMHQAPNAALIPLSAIVQEKSQGIPFYIRMILDTCYRKNCIWYCWKDSIWQYDIDRIFTELAAPGYGQGLGNEFVAKRFQELPDEARSILLWAALLGSPFSFSLIQKLQSGEFLYSIGGEDDEDVTCPRRTKLSQSNANIVAGLQYLLQSYIILPGDTDDEFRFAFDRYAQGVTLMKQCHNQEKMHFIIAQTMMKYFSADGATLYSRAQHICHASRLIKERVALRSTYRKELSEAASRAHKSGAKSTALSYYQTCIFLLQDDPWSNDASDVDYEETMELYLKTAEMLIALNQTSEASAALSAIFANAHTPTCKAKAWILQSRIHSLEGDNSTATDVLLKFLRELGVEISWEVGYEECEEEYMKLSDYLHEADLNEIFSQPLSEDRTLMATAAVMSEALSLCFWVCPRVFFRFTVEMMNLYLFRGAFPQMALLCTHLSMIAMSRFKDTELGFKLSEAAMSFLDKFNDPPLVARGIMVHNMYVNHYRVPIASTFPLLEESAQVARSIGDRNLSLLSICVMVVTCFSLGQDFAELEAHCDYTVEEVPDWTSDTRGGVIITGVRQAARALQGKTYTGSPEQMGSDDHHNEMEYLRSITSRGATLHTLNLYHSIMLAPLYLYGHHERVIETGTSIIDNIAYLWSSRLATQTYFYVALATLSLHLDNPSRPGLEQDVELVHKYKKEVDFMATACDTNYGMWSLLLQALICEVNGNFPGSMKALEDALDHTQLHNWPLEEAIALELQVEFFVRRGARRAAQSILRSSVAAWNRMSATGKAKQLAEKHEWLLRMGTVSRANDVGCQTVDTLAVPSSSMPEPSPIQGHLDDERNRKWLEQDQDRADGTLDVSRVGLDIIDLSNILEFSQVISSELQIDKLLTKMVGIILESCNGAELALVITECESHEWCVSAAADTENGETAYPEGLPFSEVEDKLAQQITHYTLRTREFVLVHNVLEDERFSNVSEAYAARNPEGRSVIALPIIQANNLLGVIHIEGKPNSFTHRNLVVLRLLCNQVGISLANAFLFQEARKVSSANAAMVETQKRALALAREAEQKSKAAEEEAKHNVKLKENAAKAKSIFLANISHDLRTPMTGVIGLSELLKQTNLDRQQDIYVESIRVCADTLLTLINDILDFSKLEAGKMKVSIVPLNLKQTIAEVIRALRYTHRDRGLETIEDLDDIDENLLVFSDPVRLHQIFMNLLSNSYKFTPKGSVTVRAKMAEETKDKVRVTCTVADTGIGISSEQLVRLFRPFSQADSSTARSYGGSGLGLSICKAIIEDVLHGKIWLQSQEGSGTTVTFTVVFQKAPEGTVVRTPWSQEVVPERKPQVQKRIIRDLTTIPREEIRVCIAEDNPINQKIAVNFVRNLGLNCEVFGDGEQAVQALKQGSKEGNPFHVVLMDVMMPVLDGYNATRKIREDEDTNVNEVLVIAMTASAIEGDREKCIEAGMNNYLAKPVRSDVLRNMLDRYLAPDIKLLQRRKPSSLYRPSVDSQIRTPSSEYVLPDRSRNDGQVGRSLNGAAKAKVKDIPISSETNGNGAPPTAEISGPSRLPD